MEPSPVVDNWESAIAELLGELSSTQQELLNLLAEKRPLLVAGDAAGLAALEGREGELLARLEACQQRRADLLAQAKTQGKPSTSVRRLVGSLSRAERTAVEGSLREAAARSRLLQHQSLTNWVIVQRNLIHLAQMLEIIATRGRPKPTYGKEASAAPSGAFVDQAA